MIPFYIFYSMFGFQRIGDLVWAAGDMRARGFLLGGTAGRTTLNGEGLQHEDGHSHVLSAAVPNCVAYDPTFAYELAVIIQDGLRRMFAEQEDVFYYLTVITRTTSIRRCRQGVARRHRPRHVPASAPAAAAKAPRVQLLGSGAILSEVIAGADLLAEDWGVVADVWSVTELHGTPPRRRGGRALEPASPGRAAAQEPCRELPRRTTGAGGRRHRLHQVFAEQIRRMCRVRYHRARHRRLRPSAITGGGCATSSRSTGIG